MSDNAVLYPDMRENVLGAIRDLGDIPLQRGWTQTDKGGGGSPISDIVCILYDLAGLRDDPPEAWVGVLFRDGEEARLADALMANLDKLFQEHGVEKSDASYTATPEWFAVVSAAQDFIAYVDA